jgi:hypothetical protein
MVLAQVLCWHAAANAEKRPLAQPAAKKALTERHMSERQRVAAAVRAVKATEQSVLRKGYSLELRPEQVPFNGNPTNPITGAGPIEVTVWKRPQGRHRWMWSWMTPFFKTRYLVNVCRHGQACVLDRVSDNPLARLGRFLTPVREVAGDIVRSKQALGGVFQVAMGAFVTGATGGLAQTVGAAAIVNGVHFVFGALQERKQARRQALEDTATWARKVGKKAEHYPYIADAYRHYRERVEEIDSGTQSASLKKFAEQLSANGL